MNRVLKFTIWHGVAASLALHSALALPFVVHRFAPPPDDRPMLVIEVQGEVADRQDDERAELQAEAEPVQPPPAPPPPQKTAPPEAQDEEAARPQRQISPPQRQSDSAQADQVPDADAQQKSRILERDIEADRLREYLTRLSKKIRTKLVHPDRAGLYGNARVSFTLTLDGQIKPGTLRIVTSSGQPKLDAAALATVRASAPFDPPPREMTVSPDVLYSRDK